MVFVIPSKVGCGEESCEDAETPQFPLDVSLKSIVKRPFRSIWNGCELDIISGSRVRHLPGSDLNQTLSG